MVVKVAGYISKGRGGGGGDWRERSEERVGRREVGLC